MGGRTRCWIGLCSWRQLPHDFPPWDTVYWYFKIWNEAGVTDPIHDALRAALRDADGRVPMAGAGIVDAQSIKGADTVGKNSRGYDAGKITAASGTSSPTRSACWSWCW
ncbi:MAG TPA: transposase [Streptosporangiaceae bacterium]|nr:transposase [Streptosporangiaceae bacterium]